MKDNTRNTNSGLSENSPIALKTYNNYLDDTVLTLLTKRKKNVVVTLYTKTISKQLMLDVKKYNIQYPPVEVVRLDQAHDRFIIIDNESVYHVGASLKDLGKKWFAFSRMDKNALTIIDKLKK